MANLNDSYALYRQNPALYEQGFFRTLTVYVKACIRRGGLNAATNPASEHAEDIAQNICLQVSQLKTAPLNFTTWLNAAIANDQVDHFRAHRRQPSQMPVDPETGVELEYEPVYEAGDDFPILPDEMSEFERKLCHGILAGYSLVEMAEQAGVAYRTIQSRFRRMVERCPA